MKSGTLVRSFLAQSTQATWTATIQRSILCFNMSGARILPTVHCFNVDLPQGFRILHHCRVTLCLRRFRFFFTRAGSHLGHLSNLGHATRSSLASLGSFRKVHRQLYGTSDFRRKKTTWFQEKETFELILAIRICSFFLSLEIPGLALALQIKILRTTGLGCRSNYAWKYWGVVSPREKIWERTASCTQKYKGYSCYWDERSEFFAQRFHIPFTSQPAISFAVPSHFHLCQPLEFWSTSNIKQ